MAWQDDKAGPDSNLCDRLGKEAEQDGSYRVAKRLQAVVMNAEGL